MFNPLFRWHYASEIYNIGTTDVVVKEEVAPSPVPVLPKMPVAPGNNLARPAQVVQQFMPINFINYVNHTSGDDW